MHAWLSFDKRNSEEAMQRVAAVVEYQAAIDQFNISSFWNAIRRAMVPVGNGSDCVVAVVQRSDGYETGEG